MKMSLIFFFSLLALALVGCGSQRQYEVYQMTLSDLQVNSYNHPHGYGKSECFACHIPSNIHNTDRLGAPSFPLAKALVEQQGLASCSGCHGANGVQ